MCRARLAFFSGILICSSAFALGHSKRFSAIDEYCAQLQQDVSSSTPFVFAGPDPWVQIDEIPAAMPSEALALVYTEGPEIRWVFLRIEDTAEGWAEDVDYFFQQDGMLVKRARHVRSPAANVDLEVITYYESGRVLKQSTHHHALDRGHENTSAFSDPEAPVFRSIDELPFGEIAELWRRLI